VLIDTHAHLDDPQLAGETPAILERARSAGVERVVTVATTAPSSMACLALAEQHPELAATAGIHPNHVAGAAPDDWDRILELVQTGRFMALGETGLDRHWNDTPFPQQEEFFVRHLELSRQSGLPVVIHCREAEADMLRVLRTQFDQHGPLHGVMHSFVGDRAMAEACLAMGLYLSFAGMLTYKNAAALREVAATVPLDRILVETDSPYLAPVPLRGKRNEPGNVVHTATCLAGLHGLELRQLAERTSANARALFALIV
jgi:TatD DNase family protein